MMAALTDERAAALRAVQRAADRRVRDGGPDPARGGTGAEPVSLSDYAGSAQGGRTADQYGGPPRLVRPGAAERRGPAVRHADAVRQRAQYGAADLSTGDTSTRAGRVRADYYSAGQQYGAQAVRPAVAVRARRSTAPRPSTTPGSAVRRSATARAANGTAPQVRPSRSPGSAVAVRRRGGPGRPVPPAPTAQPGDVPVRRRARVRRHRVRRRELRRRRPGQPRPAGRPAGRRAVRVRHGGPVPGPAGRGRVLLPTRRRPPGRSRPTATRRRRASRPSVTARPRPRPTAPPARRARAGARASATRAQHAAGGRAAPPEESHGDDTGPQPAARYADQAAYGQAPAPSTTCRHTTCRRV